MKKTSFILILSVILVIVFSLGATAFAAEEAGTSTETIGATDSAAEAASSDDGTSTKAVAAAAVVAIVAATGAVGMAIAIAKCAGAMSRQPEAAGKINSAMMLGLVFIETAIIYALIVAILIIFVL